MTTWLHSQRLDAVMAALRAGGVRSVLDLGCGNGDLILRLLQEPQIDRILGLDRDRGALEALQARLSAAEDRARVTLVAGSLLDAGAELRGFDCVVLVETLEHIAPDRLSVLETVIFERIAAPRVVLTTPNADFNPVLGVPAHRFRHPEHAFEWGRRRFRDWAQGVALRQGVMVACSDIAATHPELGGASQMAVFTRPG